MDGDPAMGSDGEMLPALLRRLAAGPAEAGRVEVPSDVLLDAATRISVLERRADIVPMTNEERADVEEAMTAMLRVAMPAASLDPKDADVLGPHLVSAMMCTYARSEHGVGQG